jgi:hypothetical protein
MAQGAIFRNVRNGWKAAIGAGGVKLLTGPLELARKLDIISVELAFGR